MRNENVEGAILRGEDIEGVILRGEDISVEAQNGTINKKS